MQQSGFVYQYELTPKIRDTAHSIGVRTDPSINNVESFAVVLFFQQRDGTRVEVAKIDDSTHDEGDIHIDQYYRECGAEVKEFDTSIGDYIEAEAYMKENWQRFARRYNTNHGTEVRADGANA